MKTAGTLRILSLTTLLVLQLLLVPVPIYAETGSSTEESHHETTRRPVVAVALAGGGAWGFSHVGVLEAIEELGIPVDIVVGTSIGSIVGALYAAGYTTEQLVIIAETTDWNHVLFGVADRLQLGYEDRRRRRAFRATLGFRDGEALVPSGASSAQRVVEYLDDLLRAHALTDSFLDMPRKLAIVAADLVTGEEVVFTDGDLKTAVRASISVPGAFTPVYYDGRYLIDGGWVNNIPVDVARALGADIVIAINLSVMDRKPEDLQSIGSILDQSARILRQESILRNLDLADVVITPDLRGLLPTDFQRADSLIERGRDAAVENRDTLEELARRIRGATEFESYSSPLSYRPEMNRTVMLTSARYVIPPVSLPAAEQFNPGAIALLETLVDRMEKVNTSIEDIQKEVYALYDTGLFEYITYDVVDRQELVVYAVPRETPRSTLSLGLGFRGQLLENTIGMGLAHLRYRYDPGEGSTRIIADGWLSRIAGARLTMEVPVTPHIFVTPALYAVGENSPFYDGRSIESFYVRRRFGVETGLQAYIGRSWDMGLVGFGEWLALQRLEGSRVFDFGGTARYGGRLEVWRDTLDHDLFPRRGSETKLAYRVHWDSEQEHLAHLAGAATRRYWSPTRDITVNALARVGTDMLSGVAVYERFFLGGVENWYGYYYHEMQARHFAAGGVEGRVTIGRLPLALGDRFYLVGGVQTGGIHNGELSRFLEEIDPRTGVHGGLAFDTTLGALHIGAAINGEGRIMSYIELGPVYTMGGTGFDW